SKTSTTESMRGRSFTNDTDYEGWERPSKLLAFHGNKAQCWPARVAEHWLWPLAPGLLVQEEGMGNANDHHRQATASPTPAVLSFGVKILALNIRLLS